MTGRKLYVAKRTGGGPATTPVRQSQAGSRPEQRGTSCSGRIASLVHGQGHGFIRLADRRTVFFHRSDLCEGTRFGDLAVGETLTFELLEDPISGPRALRVQREKPNR